MKITTALKSVSIVGACFFLYLVVRFTTNGQIVFDHTPTNHIAIVRGPGMTFTNAALPEEERVIAQFTGNTSEEIVRSMNFGVAISEQNFNEFLLRNLVMKSNNYLYNCMRSEINLCEKELTFKATLEKKDSQYIELERYKL